MNIRKQMVISNLLMIIIPVMAAAVAGLCCIGMLWYVIHHGSGVGVDDSMDFSWLAHLSVSYVQDAMNNDEAETPSDPLSQLLDANTMHLIIMKDGAVAYSYGTDEEIDEQILESADAVPGHEIMLSSEGRNMYLARMEMEDGFYEVYLFATMHDMETRAFRIAASVTWVVLVCTIVLSVFITNRFLIRSLIRRIIAPLNMLSEGAKELGGGNLDYRIAYEKDDEFTPLCNLFNEMAERLKNLIIETEKDEENRKELIAGISHDLRSPLTSIQAYVEGLQDGIATSPEMRARYIAVILEKVRDIDMLVSQLFLFSKLELDDYPVSLQPLDIAAFIASFIEKRGTEYKEKGLEIIGSPAADCMYVIADADLLERIFINIADNSTKYRNAENAHLWIDASCSSDESVIVLSDDGPGVEDGEYARLFDVFYRSDKSRRNPSGGSGLGLAISKKMTERMEGSIHAEKGKHGGLAMIIHLKRAAGKDGNGGKTR